MNDLTTPTIKRVINIRSMRFCPSIEKNSINNGENFKISDLHKLNRLNGYSLVESLNKNKDIVRSLSFYNQMFGKTSEIEIEQNLENHTLNPLYEIVNCENDSTKMLSNELKNNIDIKNKNSIDQKIENNEPNYLSTTSNISYDNSMKRMVNLLEKSESNLFYDVSLRIFITTIYKLVYNYFGH